MLWVWQVSRVQRLWRCKASSDLQRFAIYLAGKQKGRQNDLAALLFQRFGLLLNSGQNVFQHVKF
jgi:hypothetical protein